MLKDPPSEVHPPSPIRDECYDYLTDHPTIILSSFFDEKDEWIQPIELVDKYIVNIDFNEASLAWRKNKINSKNGTFLYRCGILTTSGKICKKSRQSCKSANHIKKRTY
jgi:hypothetical protein